LSILHRRAAHFRAGEHLHAKLRGSAILCQIDDAGIDAILAYLSIPDDT
jgi:hypothetical protein